MFSFVRVDRVDRLSVVFPHCREAVFKRLHVGTVSLALLSGNFVVQSAGMLRLFSDRKLFLLIVLPVALYQLSVCGAEYVLV